MAQTSFRFDDEIKEWVDNRLIQGQNAAVWYRYAVESVFAADQYLDDIYEPYQYDERKAFIEEAVRKEVERRKDEVDKSTEENQG